MIEMPIPQVQGLKAMAQPMNIRSSNENCHPVPGHVIFYCMSYKNMSS